MRKTLIKITSLILIFSLLLSSSPSIFLGYGKCDPDDTDCKLKKEAKKSCSSADDVESCREGRQRAQEELNKQKVQKQTAIVATQTEITDPQEAGDLTWNACKEGGGNDAACRSRAERAYLEVEKVHPVNAATKEAHIIRDTLRKTALETAGGSEALTAEQAERIRRESDIASNPVLKKEYKEDFYNQLLNRYGQDVTDEEIRQFNNEYYQQNRDRYALPLSTESDLAGLGKDLLNRASVSEYLDKQLGPEPEPELTEEQKLARIESNVQQLVQQNCQSGDLVVELENAMAYSGFYRCRDGQKITSQEASRLKNQRKMAVAMGIAKAEQMAAIEQRNQDFTPYTPVTQFDLQQTEELFTALTSTPEERGIPSDLPEDLT
ncbi:MAG: hypothetical protein MUP45_00570, partial [Candidatus Marinimicrobia bacterium]|nr:hypothetical protein [Candidatus Neomarinimicrobiota bacterium]